ncbi:hypothetical protein Agabi119p4_2097 [Agaricus bisporus var. burnettii]|uniref:Leucine carboxyl methyltransferase 1 n=1 Tax=Agaricus bisporus var. burnettii TaxID=192524 RepID=A0A8H7F8D9_AGABI|nr:hypothetical protein Agabi119p4_2097 [Agaricus bisporus var. burnettii]
MYSQPSLLPRQDPDAPIRQTDNDAAVARLSAVQKHYLDDLFVKHLVPRAHLQPNRPPLINIGTYIRTRGIEDLVDVWVQGVIPGSGALRKTGPHKDTLIKYFEVDFGEITSKKSMSIMKNRELRDVLGGSNHIQIAEGGTVLHSQQYHLLAADLRRDPVDTLQEPLTKQSHGSQEPILSPQCPTLLLFECVLAYMEVNVSSRLLQWFVDYFSADGGGAPLGCVIYEMFGLNDPFGRVMLNNLRARSVTLPGAEPFMTLDSLIERLLKTGFHKGWALTLKEIRKSYIEPEELARISRLEMLDETEELELTRKNGAIGA